MLEPPVKETLTLDDLACRYYVDRRTILKWIGQGKAPKGQKIGKQWLFSRTAVLEFERQRER